MLYKACWVFCFLSLFLSTACRRGKDSNISDDPTQEVPIDQIDDAPADQLKALTEEVLPDSTEPDCNFKYDGAYIYVSKPQMRLYVVDANDSVIYSCGIACGLRKGPKQEKDDYKTPEGHFEIAGMFNSTDWIHKRKDGREVKGCYGPYFLRLRTGRFSGIGIHGTNAPGSIGRRASEGCIRVNSANIVVLHDEYAYEGMPVIVSGERELLPDFKGLHNDQPAANRSVSHADSLHHRDSVHVPRETVNPDDVSADRHPATRRGEDHTTRIHDDSRHEAQSPEDDNSESLFD